jgi:hypothetical protein
VENWKWMAERATGKMKTAMAAGEKGLSSLIIGKKHKDTQTPFLPAKGHHD